MQISATQRLMLIMDEISIAKGKLQPHDTGHLHDYIANMERRIEELNDNEE